MPRPFSFPSTTASISCDLAFSLSWAAKAASADLLRATILSTAGDSARPSRATNPASSTVRIPRTAGRALIGASRVKGRTYTDPADLFTQPVACLAPAGDGRRGQAGPGPQNLGIPDLHRQGGGPAAGTWLSLQPPGWASG